MNLFQILKYIYTYPLNRNHKLASFFIFFKWQLSQRIIKLPVIYNITNKARLILYKGRTGATGNLYLGLMELSEMGFLLHFLEADDLFVDIGANIGSFTILASAEKGAKTIAIEPVPSTFSCLIDNVNLNNVSDKVVLKNIGLSSKEERLFFTNDLDSINHVSQTESDNVVEVPVSTLDIILGSAHPILIKIDVEGYEYAVIQGAKNVLKNPNLKAIIIELAGLGKQYSFDEREIHKILTQHNFVPYKYDPINRELKKLIEPGTENTIYIRDESFVKERLSKSHRISIGLFNDAI